MQTFLKNLGIILILGGFIFLVISVLKGMATNAFLLTSAIAIVGGLLVHIILNRIVE